MILQGYCVNSDLSCACIQSVKLILPLSRIKWRIHRDGVLESVATRWRQSVVQCGDHQGAISEHGLTEPICKKLCQIYIFVLAEILTGINFEVEAEFSYDVSVLSKEEPDPDCEARISIDLVLLCGQDSQIPLTLRVGE